MILHITTRTAWEAAVAAGSYTAASLVDEGFIHCSTVSQTVATANLYYLGQAGLVLLCIDEGAVAGTLKYEAPAGARDEADGALFPHLYGALAIAHVTRIVDFPPDPVDGTFVLPAGIEDR